MSIFRYGLQLLGTTSRNSLQRVISARSIAQSVVRHQEAQQQELGNEIQETESTIPPESDRSKEVPIEVALKYMKSDAYKETYGTEPVWKRYRRNFKGQLPPRKTRKTCIRQNFLATSNPCPICRDEFLRLDYRNTDLLYQFISPYNGGLLDWNKTGICQRQHLNLKIAIHKAREYGTITFDVPFKQYDYSEWYKPEDKSTPKEEK